MKLIQILLIILPLFLFYSCEKKEGVYFERDSISYDSTTYLTNYIVYSYGEVVYEEEMGIKIKLSDLQKIKDSLQEIHKDKFDMFYIECKSKY